MNIKTRHRAMNNGVHRSMHTNTSKLCFYEGHRQHSPAAAAMNWLLPNTVGTTTVATATTPSASEPDCPSPSSPAFSAAGAAVANEDQTDSGRSSPSASSSSSAADTFSFSASGPQRSASTSTSALCFGAGGAGVRLWSSNKALARASKIHGEEEEDAQAAVNVAPKGFAVGRHLRRISRRVRKARAAKKTPAATPRRGAVDDTARERADALASAIAHCKETLRRGMPRRRRLPPPLSSLSLDLWLRDRQDEIIASAAEFGDARRPTPATALARHAPCMRLPLSHIAPPVAAATGTPPSQISGGVASRATETRGGFSELEFLETFDGDDELIDRHFITVQI